jgi:ATP-dependent Lhr-like helicase
VAAVVSQLAGFEVPAAAWEANVLPARVRGYKREWLDTVTLSGEAVWGRLWGAGASAIRRTPIALAPREDIDAWCALAPPFDATPSHPAGQVQSALARRGAMFFQELVRETGLSAGEVEEGLTESIAFGRATCDSFGGLRWLVVPASRRRAAGLTAGRWTLLRRDGSAPASDPRASAEFVARRLLARTGVVFRKTLAREKQPIPWRDLARALRTMEARGEVRGGRFVAGFDGEQYALADAVTLLRSVRRRDASAEILAPLTVSAADPLNYRGILTPDERVSSATRREVLVA